MQGIFSILYGKITLTFYLGPKNTHLETLLAAICQTERQFYSLIPWELPTLFLRPPSSLVLTFQLMAGREMKTYPFQSPFNKAHFINQRFCTKGALRKRVWNVIFLKTSSSTQLIKLGLHTSNVSIVWDLKSDNLQYDMLGRWVDGTIVPPSNGAIIILINWELNSGSMAWP